MKRKDFVTINHCPWPGSSVNIAKKSETKTIFGIWDKLINFLEYYNHFGFFFIYAKSRKLL